MAKHPFRVDLAMVHPRVWVYQRGDAVHDNLEVGAQGRGSVSYYFVFNNRPSEMVPLRRLYRTVYHGPFPIVDHSAPFTQTAPDSARHPLRVEVCVERPRKQHLFEQPISPSKESTRRRTEPDTQTIYSSYPYL